MTSHRYNTKNYNESHYNNDGTSYILTLVEAISSMDALYRACFKALSESVSSSDLRTVDQSRSLSDAIIAVDTLSKQITNKILTDSVRLNDWLRIVRQSDNWNS